MGRVFTLLSKATDVLMAVCLAGMAILVFGNVVLRYAFDSGITWSEEMSRFLFVWLTFLGAIGALKDNQHLGVDMFVKKLSLPLRRVVYIISNLLVLYVLWLVFDGSWRTTLVSTSALAPATGMPMSYVYGIGMVTSIAMGFIILVNLYRVLFRKETAPITGVEKSQEESPPAGQDASAAHQKQFAAGGKDTCH